jgi:oxygen-independent coproporphyrinogen-3 oxidase
MTKLSPTFSPQQIPPRSVYIHVPFCRHRCGYCNFSVVADRDYLIQRFLRGIETEIQSLDRRYEIDTLFLGGGTPSHLPPADFARLFEIVRSRFDLAIDAEVTAECNPSDVSQDRVALFQQSGVNRVSLGVQSFNEAKLKRLERDHTPAIVTDAVEMIRKRIDNVSMDLIFAAPMETLGDWRVDLEAAMDLNPSHLSTYELTFEKGTRFWNRLNQGELRQSNEDLRARMYEHTLDRTAEAGLDQYEVSSFAGRGNRCRHNLAYWNGEPYFAFGPGASRFVDGIRETNHQSTMYYLKQMELGRSPVADCERLDPQHAAAERLAIGLRQNDGVDKQLFFDAVGVSVDEMLGEFRTTMLENGLAIDDGAVLRLTRRGMMMCDRVSVEILDRL